MKSDSGSMLAGVNVSEEHRKSLIAAHFDVLRARNELDAAVARFNSVQLRVLHEMEAAGKVFTPDFREVRDARAEN